MNKYGRGERATYIRNIGHFELARLSESDSWDHGARADGALIALAIKLLGPDVENIVADGERGAEHDDSIYWGVDA